MKVVTMWSRIIQNFNHEPYKIKKFLSTIKNVKKKNDTKQIYRKERTIPQEIYSQLQESNLEYFLEKLPSAIFQRSRTNLHNVYLINKSVAQKINEMICKDLLKNSSYVIECNPGFGLLTEELLNAGIPSITLFEKSEKFLVDDSPMEKLFNKFKSCINLKKFNFIDIWINLLRDKHTSESIGLTYFTDAPYCKWNQESFAQIISMNASRSFLSLIIHNFFNQTSIFDHGRPLFFMIMPYTIWERIISDNTSRKARYYSHYSVILHLFFEYECLGNVPRKAFVPWPKQKQVQKSINSQQTENKMDMIVLKLEPKKETFSIITKKDLRVFWFFLKYFMRSRKYRIIEEFEKLVPGCGPRLIQLDVNICTTVKELSPKQLLEIFIEFRSWPEYNPNLFPTMEINDEEKKEDENILMDNEDEEKHL